MEISRTNKIDIKLLGRILRYTLPYRYLFAFVAFLAISLSVMTVLRPKLITIMVDENIMTNDLTGLTFIAFLFFVVVLLNVLSTAFFTYNTAKLGQHVINDIRTEVFNHFLKMRMNYFEQTPVGQITTRTVSDIEAINSIFSQGFITIIADLLKVMVVLGMMLHESWKLTLISIVTLPMLLIATYIFKERVKKAYQKARTMVSKMNAFLQERISGIKIIQLFSIEEKVALQFGIINKDYKESRLDEVKSYAVFYPVVEFIYYLTLVIMVWWGSKWILNETLSYGVIVAFPIYIELLYRPIRMLADKFNQLQYGMIAASRVFDVLDDQSFIPDLGHNTANRIDGKIEFDAVDFAYDGVNNVINKLSFLVNPNESLAIVGSTGSGKTTIIKLLSRYYDIQAGSISIDNIDIKKYKLANLRKHMTIVLQDVFLFHGSVWNNINLMDDSISKESILEASKKIGAHEFITQLPNGYDYIITERGSNLSMGQRQLISFVRALVFNPCILILDEATSSIDPHTESVIQHAIEKLIDKRTSIVIAHRLSTIRHATNIMVMDQGQNIEFGSHNMLISNVDGKYRQLYDMQFAHLIEEV